MTYETGRFGAVLAGGFAVALIAGTAALGYWHFGGHSSFTSSRETENTDPSALCLDQTIQGLAKMEIAEAIADRAQSGPWESGSRRLRNWEDVTPRLSLSQPSYRGVSTDGRKIGCWATVRLDPPDDTFENAAYARTTRIMFSVENTLDGTAPVVELVRRGSLSDHARQWAQAEVLYNPTSELETALGAWKSYDEEMKATEGERLAQIERQHAAADAWNTRYQEAFSKCPIGSDECQRRAKAYADQPDEAKARSALSETE